MTFLLFSWSCLICILIALFTAQRMLWAERRRDRVGKNWPAFASTCSSWLGSLDGAHPMAACTMQRARFQRLHETSVSAVPAASNSQVCVCFRCSNSGGNSLATQQSAFRDLVALQPFSKKMVLWNLTNEISAMSSSPKLVTFGGDPLAPWNPPPKCRIN